MLIAIAVTLLSDSQVAHGHGHDLLQHCPSVCELCPQLLYAPGLEVYLFHLQVLDLGWEKGFPPIQHEVRSVPQRRLLAHAISHCYVGEQVVPLLALAPIQQTPTKSLFKCLRHPLNHAIRLRVLSRCHPMGDLLVGQESLELPKELCAPICEDLPRCPIPCQHIFRERTCHPS